MDLRRNLLAAWADLAPVPEATVPLVVASSEDFHWLGGGGLFPLAPLRSRSIVWTPALQRLAQLDALHADEPVLREGWVFLAGSIERHGERVPVLQPLLSRPVRLASPGLAPLLSRLAVPPDADRLLVLRADGEAEASPLVADADRRADLAARAEFGRGGLPDFVTGAVLRRMPLLREWIQAAVVATGLAPGMPPISTQSPLDLVGRIPDLRVVVGGALYAAPEAPRPVAAAALAEWSRAKGLEATAFGALYPDDLIGGEGRLDGERAPAGARDGSQVSVTSPFPLSPSQRRVVVAARGRDLTVVSGAPGNGKSHTVAAVALDHVAHGQSVLVATRSRFAARSIAEIIDRVPGPDALRFGDIVDGSTVADELNDHLLEADGDDGADERLDAAVARRDALRRAVSGALELEEAATADAGPVTAMRVLAPRAFELDTDLAELRRLAGEAVAAPRGPLARWRHRRAVARLASAVGAPVDDPGAVADAIERARRRRAALLLAADGGTRIGETWDRLAEAEAAVRAAAGDATRARQDRGRRARGAVSELLAALRAGRGRRRELLARIDPAALTAAVPLWVGTLVDIEDLLPAQAAMFDLVILDEAAHVDQLGAAPALLRARRAMVVGDPRQLRHVSFLADDAVAEAMGAHGLPELAPVLDLRRNSVYDRAAAVAPVVELAEHYRSVPHLVAFPIAEFYRDRVEVMTRRPDNDGLDVIDVLSPVRPDNAAEVEAVVAWLLERRDRGEAGTVGVISPFRRHVEAIKDAVVEQFDEADIRAMGLRVSTVHGFQGAERDVTVLALGLSPEDPGGRLAFVENPNLFNVMVTRARDRTVVLTAVTQPRSGLLARFLRHADRPPVPMADEGTDHEWTRALAVELERAGIATRLGYRIGPWTLDLVVDDPTSAIAIETRVAGGVDAHIERHRTLADLGWAFVEAYPSRWEHDVARAALDLTVQLHPTL